MARNNHVWVKGDITGDIYFDILKLMASRSNTCACT